MKTLNIVKGISILHKYRSKPGYDMGADHDEIYLFPPDLLLSDEDIQKMIGLGFYQNVPFEETFSLSDYDEDASWHAYL